MTTDRLPTWQRVLIAIFLVLLVLVISGWITISSGGHVSRPAPASQMIVTAT